jgi:hypothetical protein
MRVITPLAACSEDIKDGVDDFAQGVVSGMPAFLVLLP